MKQMVKIDIDLVQYLTEVAEIVEILDDGITFLTTKNGVVMRETVGKWGQVLCEENGVIWIEDDDEQSLSVSLDKDLTEEIIIKMNEGVSPEDFVDALNKPASDTELTEMAEITVEKPKKATKKKTKAVK